MKQRNLWLILGLLIIFIFGFTSFQVKAKNQVNVLLIVDASGSMTEKIGQEPKMDIAKRVSKDFINSLSPYVNLGLRSYGLGINRQEYESEEKRLLEEYNAAYSRRDFKSQAITHYYKNVEDLKLNLSCETSLLFPIQELKGKKTEIISNIEGMEAYGATPLAKSLEQGLNDFSNKMKAEDRNFLILVSDGIETCGGNPVEVANLLKERHSEPISFYVIGFDIDAETAEKLKPIAEAGGGTYYTAQNAEELNKAIGEVSKKIEIEVEKTGKTKGGKWLYFILGGIAVIIIIGFVIKKILIKKGKI